MRPELNNKLKERLFAQYWGCISEVTKSNFYPKKAGDKSIIDGSIIDNYLKNYKLKMAVLLRPLSSITDEEAIEVADIVGLLIATKDKRKTLVDYLNNEMSREFESLGSHAVDYLRSKGFALPFMGYSVEELINAGFIKLTE